MKHVIRDVLHGYVRLDDADRQIVDTPIFQRLRHIKQNDVAYLVYPSLTTSRFEHSLGVMHVAGRLAESALENGLSADRDLYLSHLVDALPESLREKGRRDPRALFVRVARWYGLLHDIGHLPFSHLTEHCLGAHNTALYPGTTFAKIHESAGQWIMTNDTQLKAVLETDPAAGHLVSQLMSAKRVRLPHLLPLKDIVDSDVDADRIDSTARDGLLGGGDYGHYDIARLTHHATLCRDGDTWRVFFTTRAISAVESLLVERVKTYRWIHYKPKVVAFKNAFRHCFDSLEHQPTDWHADKYVDDRGYLDDGRALDRIGSMPLAGRPPHVLFAREAVIRRTAMARPLWKRRDEYRELSKRVAAGAAQREAVDKESPILNKLYPPEPKELEDRLNDGLKGDIRYLVAGTKLAPFEPSRYDDTIGTYKVIHHATKAAVLLTEESRLVQSLSNVVKNEAAITVTVLGDPDGNRQSELLDRFVTVARSLLPD